jgi:putative transposase
MKDASLSAYRSNKHVKYSCKYHIIFCPKYRRKVLVEEVSERLEQILKDLCIELNCILIEYEIMPDHVHLLVDVDPVLGVNSFVSRLKGRSSRVLRSEFPSLKSRLPCLWTSSYFVSTVGGVSLEVVKQYIDNQKNV